jgi:hypothetical protein
MKLFAPQSYWNSSQAVRDEITGGCGPGKLGDWLVPDTVWFLSIKEACQIHDWMWHFGETNKDKKKADRVFLNNMNRIIDANTKWRWLRKLRKRRALKYYLAVKYLGGIAFWRGKNSNVEYR